MKARRIVVLLAFTIGALALVGSGGLLALSETRLTPTNKNVVAAEDQEFNAAMAAWNGHKYEDGEKMLREFAKKNPNSRWAAELHCGCNLVYKKNYKEAKEFFDKVIKDHPTNNVAVKAKIRLGNIAEATADFNEGIRQYNEVLSMNPTWDQFKYANFHARELIRKRHHRQAMINCGPVALAACLDALGNPGGALAAKGLNPGEDGMSLAAVALEARILLRSHTARPLTTFQP